MVDQPQYLTPEGLETLEKQLKELKEFRRPQVLDRLHRSLQEGGELSENAEYEDAKIEQAYIEGQIVRLETILRQAEVIEPTDHYDKVMIGAHVTVVEKGYDDPEQYQIVGSAEANPREGKISVESPIGKALLGAKVGAKVKVATPDGETVFKIKSID